MFSQAFCDEKKATHVDQLENENASRSVQTVIRMVIMGFKVAKKVIPRHFIKVTRTLIKTVKTIFVKALQDTIRFQNCAQCSNEDKETVRKDAFSLLELLEYITTEAEPLQVEWSRFDKFRANSTEQVEQKFREYFFY
jgi:hypothetical protein